MSSRPAVPSNAKLFEAGRRYTQARARLWCKNLTSAQVLDAVAQRYSESRSEVRLAIDFHDDVSLLATNGDAGTTELILSGENPYLTPATVLKMARRRSGRSQRETILQASRGLHPFARPVPPGTRSELIVWDHHLDQLERARRLLCEASNDRDVFRDAIAIRTAIRALGHTLRTAGASVTIPRTSSRSPRQVGKSKLADPSVVEARKLVESVASDLPLRLWYDPPSPFVLKTLARAITAVELPVTGIISGEDKATSVSAASSLPFESPDGPGRDGGAYVIVFFSAEPAALRIGRLGTFWVPAGFLLYVGSALGGGGVSARTGRHRSQNAPKRWNVDYLKAIATPVELWWTHSPDPTVECSWAMALASMSGYCCPAPRAGANDCMSCPAHLFHATKRPSISTFAEQVGGGGGCTNTIHWQRLD